MLRALKIIKVNDFFIHVAVLKPLFQVLLAPSMAKIVLLIWSQRIVDSIKLILSMWGSKAPKTVLLSINFLKRI